jgi:hypothetical protein
MSEPVVNPGVAILCITIIGTTLTLTAMEQAPEIHTCFGRVLTPSDLENARLNRARRTTNVPPP